jgi:hypothetical protein
MVLTDGDVELDMQGAGMFEGEGDLRVVADRHSRDVAWIAAAGPAAFSATLQFFTSALPMRYGAGFGGPVDSDGRVIWRVLTGAPPGGIEREQRAGEPERVVRPGYLAVLAFLFLLAILVSPGLALMLVVLFGAGALLQRYEARR